MTHRFGLCLLLILFSGACGEAPPPAQHVVDYEGAKLISDRIANDLLQDDAEDIYQHLDVGFQMVVKDAKDVKKTLEKMYIEPGHPVNFEFKISKIGTRVDGSWVRPFRTFWYAVKTEKFQKGKYFLKVEIVPAIGGSPLNVSGFGILSFKNSIPSYLQ